MGDREGEKQHGAHGPENTGQNDSAKIVDWTPYFVMGLLNSDHPRDHGASDYGVPDGNLLAFFVSCINKATSIIGSSCRLSKGSSDSWETGPVKRWWVEFFCILAVALDTCAVSRGYQKSDLGIIRRVLIWICVKIASREIVGGIVGTKKHRQTTIIETFNGVDNTGNELCVEDDCEPAQRVDIGSIVDDWQGNGYEAEGLIYTVGATEKITRVINGPSVIIGSVLVQARVEAAGRDGEVGIQLGNEAVNGVAEGDILSICSLVGQNNIEHTIGSVVEQGDVGRIAWVDLGLDGNAGMDIAREDCVVVLTSAIPASCREVIEIVALQGILRRQAVGGLLGEDLHESEVGRQLSGFERGSQSEAGGPDEATISSRS